MANGIDFTQAAAYQAYVETFAEDLFTEIFHGFPTANVAVPHEGIKGKHILTELQISDNLARRWDATYRGTQNTAYKPEVLEVFANTIEHSVVPQNFESTYLGRQRQQGQSVSDYPMQAFVLGTMINKLVQELEVASWQGDAAETPAITDLLRQTFDGYLKQIADAITATELTPYVSGAVTSANVIATLRGMWELVTAALKASGCIIGMSYTVYDMLRIAIKDTYKVDPAYIEINDSGYEGMRFELGGNQTTIVPFPGMGSSQRIFITSAANLNYGYDSLADWSNFQIYPLHRQLDFFMDFKYGVKFTQLRDGFTVVNDQA